MKGVLAALLSFLLLRPARGARIVRPGEKGEVCEGDKIVLQCPPPSSVVLAHPSDIQWGRNGIWEPQTACGKADVSNCSTISVKETISNHCGNIVGSAYTLVHTRLQSKS